MIKTMISSMISPMIQSMVNPDSGALQRIFINNDEAAGAFYSLATPIVMSSIIVSELEVTPESSVPVPKIEVVENSIDALKSPAITIGVAKE